MKPGVGHANNFDALRLLGALLVLLGHAYLLHGETQYPAMFGSPLAVLGVVLFFSLSGYLVTTSWLNDPRPVAYFRKRLLRIVPALAVVILLSVAVLGPLFTTLSPGTYLRSPGTWEYLQNIALHPQYSLPGVFGDVPYAGVVNGSLWSLPIEFACYVLVPIIFLLPKRARGVGFVVIAALFGIGSLVMQALPLSPVVYGSSLTQATAVWPYFMVGAAIAVLGPRLPLRLDLAILALIATSVLDAVAPAAADPVWWLVLPYLIITIGTFRTPVISRAGRFGDFSYGLYLYAFPVQQALVAVAPRLPFWLSTLCTLAVSLLFAVASWHLVEKVALRFKGARRSAAESLVTHDDRRGPVLGVLEGAPHVGSDDSEREEDASRREEQHENERRVAGNRDRANEPRDEDDERRHERGE